MSSFDKVASDVRGAAKVVKANLKGLKGVFETMMKQHGEATALLKKIKGTTDMTVRATLWPKLRAELVSHERAEMQVVYPELRKHEETRALADQHDAEAKDLDGVIAKLQGMNITNEDWKLVFDELVDMVTRHVEEEEGDFFPKAQRAIGEEEAVRLDAPFKAAKKREMEMV